jgi:hypothetical protein
MILPGNATLIISAVRHIVKLGTRIDNIAAEKAAVTSPLVLTLPQVATPDLVRCAEIFDPELKRTRGVLPDPFGADRAQTEADVDAVLNRQQQPAADFGNRFAKYFPDYNFLYDPDAVTLGKLRAAFPGVNWQDPAARIAAFAIGAGGTNAQIGYAGRMALSVVDTLFEFGAENTATLVHDPKLRGIAEIVLQRFAEPDWGSSTQWNPLVQAALKSVLNAALDVADKNPASNPWLQGTLDALLNARRGVAENGGNGDDYVLGLLRGEGFRALLSQGLLVAADRLDDACANGFGLIASDVLKDAAPLVLDPNNVGFRTFFNAHWGDLLRAGLSSVDRHGDVLLAGANPRLRSVLTSMVQQLASIPDAQFFTSDTLYHLADTVIGAVADNIAAQPGLEASPWLRDFLVSAATTAKQLTARNLFTRAAAEALLRDAVGALAQHPELLVRQPGLPKEIAAAVFGSLATLSRPSARTLGEATLRAAFGAVATDPSLASRPFGTAVQSVAATLAGMVGSNQLTAAVAAQLADAAIGAIVRNPALFSGLQKDVAGAVLRAVQAAVPNTAAQPWAPRLLVQLARTVLASVARRGGRQVDTNTVEELQQWLQQVLDGGLQLAAVRLGGNLDLDDLPAVLSGLLDRALQGNLPSFNSQDETFQKAFDAIASALIPANASRQ